VRKKILVVDDDAELVELLCFNLKKAGYHASSAANGVEALKRTSASVPDLIVMDLMMPELDGFGLCEILRRNPATATVPIIMLTALSSELGRLEGLDSGATDYVTKPFSLKDLLGRVESLLRLGPEPAERGATSKLHSSAADS
jgi:DNA-binding response OmpR family regulator